MASSQVKKNYTWNRKVEAVAIGSSLGGPQALKTILSALPSEFPAPIFIVQHISTGFVEGLIDWLSKYCKLKISLAKANELALPGNIYIAPDSFHMQIKKGNIIHLSDAKPNEGLRPSISYLFCSMAETYGPDCVGIILTGMGKDGVDGLLSMKQKGAMTIAQSQEDCLMFGMPKEAIAAGAVKQIIHINHIADALLEIISRHL